MKPVFLLLPTLFYHLNKYTANPAALVQVNNVHLYAGYGEAKPLH